MRATDRQAILFHRILGAYPETPFQDTGADTPKANYNQREGPLEEAGRKIDKGIMTSELQPANDAKSGFPVRSYPSLPVNAALLTLFWVVRYI